MEMRFVAERPIPDRRLVDLEAELEWRRARNPTAQAERAANEARIVKLMQFIEDGPLPHDPPLSRPTGSLMPLLIVLLGFAIVGALISVFDRAANNQLDASCSKQLATSLACRR
jgi:hypothetical protein